MCPQRCPHETEIFVDVTGHGPSEMTPRLSRRQIAMRLDYARHAAVVDRFLRAHPVAALQI